MKKIIKIKIRYYFAILLYLFKLTPFQRQKNSFLINIINFHYFVDKKDEITDETLEVSLKIFEKQMKILSNSYKILSIKDELSLYFSNNQKNINKHSIAITIDDADHNFQKIIPYLEKYQIPVILFAPIGFCLKEKDLTGLRSRCLHFAFFQYQKENISNSDIKLKMLFDEIMTSDYNYLDLYYKKLINNIDSIFLKKKFLSLENLKTLTEHPLVTVSSHSMSHVPLSFIPNKWLEWEITESCKYIKNCGGNNSFFAYPYGYKKSFNIKTKKVLQLNKIDYAFTTIAKTTSFNANCLELGRTFIFNYKNINYLKGTASGSFELYDMILKRT